MSVETARQPALQETAGQPALQETAGQPALQETAGQPAPLLGQGLILGEAPGFIRGRVTIDLTRHLGKAWRNAPGFIRGIVTYSLQPSGGNAELGLLAAAEVERAGREVKLPRMNPGASVANLRRFQVEGNDPPVETGGFPVFDWERSHFGGNDPPVETGGFPVSHWERSHVEGNDPPVETGGFSLGTVHRLKPLCFFWVTIRIIPHGLIAQQFQRLGQDVAVVLCQDLDGGLTHIRLRKVDHARVSFVG